MTRWCRWSPARRRIPSGRAWTGPLPSVAVDDRLRGGIMEIDSLLNEMIGGLWDSRLQSEMASFCALSMPAGHVTASGYDVTTVEEMNNGDG